MKKNKCKININFTMNNSSNYLKKQIKDLNAGDQKIVLTCLVISKADPKFFEFNGQQRGVWNLILRDTEKDYINCTIWNTDEKIHDLNSIISIGCIVDIENPKITIEDEDQAFQPKCSSRFLLTIDDKRGNITLNNDFDVNNQLKILLKCPLKNTNEILRLADVSLYDKNSVGELVDLLVAIRYNRPAREILVPKTGLKKKYKSLIVMDRSNHGMSLNLWSTQSVERAENWPPLQTILFITDVRVGFSEYFQTITLTETVKTLFIVNPIGKEAEELAMYVMSTPLKDIEVSLSDDMIDVNRINDVMTVQQILEKSEGNVTRTEGDQFTALCYGVLTKFDLDGVYPCVRRRW
uniref:CSON015497 protein n=1 Tax=Culicoides sonorensis TaxID=179676 RepID=A0A336LTA1_CULSO